MESFILETLSIINLKRIYKMTKYKMTKYKMTKF